MTDHVYKKFPNYIESIQVLLEKDATLREISNDYEEICTWLEDYCRLRGRQSEECDRAREVIRDLENEINLVLKNAGF